MMSNTLPTASLSLDQLNRAGEDAFVALLDGIYEHSPWIARRAFAVRPPGGFASLAALKHAMATVVREAALDEQLGLIRAHPELAGKAAIDGRLTEASAAEQASAGLDRMTRAEYDRFHALNAAYSAKFGFPFIICVRLTDKAGILAAMERRLANDRDREIATALDQIGEIVRLRLESMA